MRVKLYGVGKDLHPSVLIQTVSDLGAETSMTTAKDQVTFPLNTPKYNLPSLPLASSFTFALAGWRLALPASATAPAPAPAPAPTPVLAAASVVVSVASFFTTSTGMVTTLAAIALTIILRGRGTRVASSPGSIGFVEAGHEVLEHLQILRRDTGVVMIVLGNVATSDWLL